MKATSLTISPFVFFPAGMKVCDVDEDNSLLSMTASQDGIPPPDPLRMDWPKVIHVYFTGYKSRLDAIRGFA